MELHIEIIGSILVGLGLIHIIFPWYFEWKKELLSLSLINKQMMTVHTFFIAIVVFLMGLLCLTSAKELNELEFGKKISLGLSIFWGIRLFIQFFGYSPKLWKGKIFETIVHVFFAFLWTYITIVFYLAYDSVHKG